jgi:hypothetical protein
MRLAWPKLAWPCNQLREGVVGIPNAFLKEAEEPLNGLRVNVAVMDVPRLEVR